MRWPTAPLGTMASCRTSNVDKKSYEGERPVRLVNYTDVYYGDRITADADLMSATASDQHFARLRVETGDVIITKDSETADDIAVPAVIDGEDGEMVCGYHLCLVRPDASRLDARYLYWTLSSRSAADYWKHTANGVTRFALGTGPIGRFPVPVLPVSAQRRIADYLDAEAAQIDGMLAELDVLIGKTRQRHSLATDWIFTMQDLPTVPLWSLYEPVKLQGYPDEEVLSVYRDHGVVPKSSRDDNNNRTPDNVTTYQLVEPGWLVVNKMKAWQGSMGISRHRGIVSPDYQVARPITNDVPEYLHEALRSARMVPEYRGRSKGIRPSQWRLYWQDMASIHVPVPSAGVQRQLLDEIRASRQATAAMIADANRLKELLIERRAALITDVITGEKEVPA